jgi:hypothetical protein
MVTPADIAAAIDVLREAAEQSENMDFDDAVALVDAIKEMRSAAGVTISMLEMALLAQVEIAPRQVGGRAFIAVDDGPLRYEHDRIESQVIDWATLQATDRETGLTNAREAARQATWMMRQVYVSPSTTAKVAALKEMEIPMDEVRTKEKKGRKLHVVETEAHDAPGPSS